MHAILQPRALKQPLEAAGGHGGAQAQGRGGAARQGAPRPAAQAARAGACSERSLPAVVKCSHMAAPHGNATQWCALANWVQGTFLQEGPGFYLQVPACTQLSHAAVKSAWARQSAAVCAGSFRSTLLHFSCLMTWLLLLCHCLQLISMAPNQPQMPLLPFPQQQPPQAPKQGARKQPAKQAVSGAGTSESPCFHAIQHRHNYKEVRAAEVLQ